MRYLLILFTIFTITIYANAEEIDSESDQEQIPNYEFPKYTDLSFANSMIERFSLYNENYFIPLYYTISGMREPYNRYEVKLQISAKVNITDNLFYGIGVFFGYTQTSFFQMYSSSLSAPFRDNDYMPELMFYRALDWKFLGGEFYNLRFGYRHVSNGEESFRSRGIDRIVAEIMYRNGGFNAHLKAWAYFNKDPSDIDKYIGYSSLTLSYNFLTSNHISLTINNLVHNYAKYKGGILAEYKFDLTKLSIYMQYFYGYGDNLYQYNIKTHSIGVGFAINLH